MVKTQTLIARAYPDEALALKILAENDRLKPSEMLRLLVRNEAQKRNLWPPKVEAKNERN